MLASNWDIAHICIAVPDIDAAMQQYTTAFGVEWGAISVFDESVIGASDIHQGGVSHDGLSAVLSRSGGSGTPPSALLELACAMPDSPAYAMWGCPGEAQYVHHLAYWVADVVEESGHLTNSGFVREMSMGPADRPLIAYHKSGSSVRVELMSKNLKPAVATFLETGELESGVSRDLLESLTSSSGRVT